MLNISPIKLLPGHHMDTAYTGQGCFMNVVAYLNGEDQITDESPCVCPILRSVIIVLNDQGGNEGREAMIPFISRAMGSRTDDVAVMQRRAKGLIGLSNDLCYILFRIEKEYGSKVSPRDTSSHIVVLNIAMSRLSNLRSRIADRAQNMSSMVEDSEELTLYLDSFASALNSAGGEIQDMAEGHNLSQLQLDLRADYRKAMFDYLDKNLPQDPLQMTPEIEARASKLVELATV